jgi:1-acyl-sn-glycerol-3-phosphate acyltransferase
MAPGARGRYNPGGAMLAKKAEVPVVPVAHNSGSFWSRRGFLKRPGVIDVRVGPPIDPSDKRPKQINAEAEAWIEAQMPDLEPGLHDIPAA